ncbi:ABC transporter permease [Paenibacillus sp. MMS20-IR301]|uniref:ABC transporter permease n=1 Tax=Paenibacillus sp. MMS20-IR301 TaxID=2895946 RepID=UPI0028ED8B18|nr:ABC transporter permease [Paenibacillus sp. MMS20-IR301]WNS42394.1 ABC transporter permease [Paenibacillus sp. MMS20-IR301]
MKQFQSALWVETLKLRRSRLFWISLATSVLLPVMIGLVFSGWLGSQDSFEGEINLTGYLKELGIILSMGGLIGFGFVFSWIFGREYSDRTVKDMLALPLSRYGTAAAKLIVAAALCAVLALIMFLTGCMTAWLVRLDGWSLGNITSGFGNYALISLMVICLSVPVAWMASTGRGYLPPLGFVLLTIVAAQFGGALGIVEYIPWAIPGLRSGASGEEQTHLQMLSLVLPYLTGGIGLIGTLAWWRYADQT